MIPVYREQIGQLVASFGYAELVSEPVLTEVADGFSIYIAQGDLAFPAGRPVRVTIYPLAEGFELPYRKGDRVRVIYNHGDAVVVGHCVSSTEEHDGNTTIQPREGKDLRLGGGSGEWEPLALHARLAAEVVELKEQINVLRDQLAAVQNPTTPGAAPVVGAIAARDALIGTISGGHEASRLNGRKN